MMRAESGAVRPMTPVTDPGTEVACGGPQRTKPLMPAARTICVLPRRIGRLTQVPRDRCGALRARQRRPAGARDAYDGGADNRQHSQPGVAHAVVDPGGAASLRAIPALGVTDPGASGRIRRSPEHTGSDPGHVRATPSDIRPIATEAVRSASHSAAAPVHASHDPEAEAANRIETARKGVGHPLPANVRTRLEHGFGEHLHSVRVDTSPAARAAAASIGARAYTEGERITLGHGESEHDLRLMAHEATHVVQNRRVGHRGQPAAVAPTEIRRDVQRAADFDTDDSRTYHTLDGRTIELPDDMTAAEAHKLEMDGVAAKRHLGQGPPPKPVPDVRKPAEKKATKTVKPPPKGAAGRHAKHATGPQSVGVKAQLTPLTSNVGQYLVAKAAPVLARGVSKIGNLSLHQQTHDNADRKVHQAKKAVVIPESDGQSKSNFSQVGVVAAKPPPEPDENKAKDELTQSLAQNVPKSIEDVDNFKRDMKAQHTGADVLKVVQTDKNAVVSTFGDMEHTPPPLPPEHAPEELPPPEAAPPTGTMNLGQGAVAPLLPEHTDVSQYTKEADDRLQKEGVSQEQLDMVDSGDLADANKEKKGLAKAAKTEPQAVQNFAKDATAKVDRDLHQEEQAQRGALAAHRKQGLHRTGEHQKGAKSALEKKRDEVAATINGIYQTTQDSVKKRLADLETQSMKRFDDGNARASKAFEDNVNRELDAYKDDRYSGVFGWARKAKDWLLGMDDLPRVKEIFETNRERFVQTLNSLVADISADNKRVVQECKDALAKAKTDIKVYVDKLGPELKDIANKTAGEVNGKLDELDGFIRKKEEELQKELADKQQAAIKAIDDKIAKMKEAMSGALAKLGNLLLWAAKKFFTWALGQFGYSLSDIESIIDKGVAVLKAIFTKPIVFVKNLIAAAKQGFLSFGKNFLTHLKDAIFDWLTGSLEGITLPSSWDLKGIASVALQMLGLTWTNIRGKLARLIGEKAVKTLETGFDLVVTLVRDGPLAAWEKIKEMGEEIKQAFIEGVQDFIKIKIIQEAIKTVVALFVPGAGIVKAVIGIYDTVVFFIQKAKQIAEFIGSFLASIGEIAAGNISAAADALESGLATGLKLVINFLARLLHLDGITAKIRGAIQKLRAKVDAVLDRIVGWIAEKGKKLFAAVFGRGEKEKDKAKDEELAAGEKLDSTATELADLSLGGEGHTLYARVAGGKVVLEMASSATGQMDIVLGRLNMLCVKALSEYRAALAANPDKKAKIEAEAKRLEYFVMVTRKNYVGEGSIYKMIENIAGGVVEPYIGMSKDQRKARAEEQLRRWLTGTSASLAASAKLGFTTLEGFKYRSGYVDEAGLLLAPYNSDVRRYFYSVKWDSSATSFQSSELTRLRLVAQKKDPSIALRPDKNGYYWSEDKTNSSGIQPYIANVKKQGDSPEIDHVTPLASRWATTGTPKPGNDTNQSDRNADYQKDLQIISDRMNKAKSGPPFTLQVKPGFRGPADPP